MEEQAQGPVEEAVNEAIHKEEEAAPKVKKMDKAKAKDVV